VIDGQVTSYFEWLGAGVYRADPRSGAMHGRQFLVREIHYGADGANVYFRLDFDTRSELARGIELRLRLLDQSGKEAGTVVVHVEDGATRASEPGVQAALRDLLEIAVPLTAIGAEPGTPLLFQISLWQGGLPLGTLPQEGSLQLSTAEPGDWVG